MAVAQAAAVAAAQAISGSSVGRVRAATSERAKAKGWLQTAAIQTRSQRGAGRPLSRRRARQMATPEEVTVVRPAPSRPEATLIGQPPNQPKCRTPSTPRIRSPRVLPRTRAAWSSSPWPSKVKLSPSDRRSGWRATISTA